jgi:hypothetical protein
LELLFFGTKILRIGGICNKLSLNPLFRKGILALFFVKKDTVRGCNCQKLSIKPELVFSFEKLFIRMFAILKTIKKPPSVSENFKPLNLFFYARVRTGGVSNSKLLTFLFLLYFKF